MNISREVFEEVEYPEYPYSEVVGFTENNDGTITLTANVVFPYAGDSKVICSRGCGSPFREWTGTICI